MIIQFTRKYYVDFWPDLLCHIATENQAITVYRSTVDEGGEGNIDKIRFRVLEDNYHHFLPCQIFIFVIFFISYDLLETNYKSSAQLDTVQNRSNLRNELISAAVLVF